MTTCFSVHPSRCLFLSSLCVFTPALSSWEPCSSTAATLAMPMTKPKGPFAVPISLLSSLQGADLPSFVKHFPFWASGSHPLASRTGCSSVFSFPPSPLSLMFTLCVQETLGPCRLWNATDPPKLVFPAGTFLLWEVLPPARSHHLTGRKNSNPSICNTKLWMFLPGALM